MTAYEYTLVKTNPPPLPQSDGPGLGASTTRDRHHPWGRCYLDGAALPLPGQVEGIGLAPGALEGGGRLPPPPLPGRPATVPQQVCQHPPSPSQMGLDRGLHHQGPPPPGEGAIWMWARPSGRKSGCQPRSPVELTED